jgi:protein arginine kinase activator
MEDDSVKMCEECGANPANVHLTQISPGKATVSHLCDACARRKGISITIADGSVAPQEVDAPAAPQSKPESGAVCPRCGMRFDEFGESGRLGCSTCYQTFEADIDRMLTEMHGSSTHKGKRYSRCANHEGTPDDLARLRGDLERAVHNEEFEEAARLRDTINAMSRADGAETAA